MFWIVGPRPLDRAIIERAGVSYRSLSVGGLNGLPLWQALPNLLRFMVAIPQAALTIRRFRPDVVLLGGGYVCAPVAVAAWLWRIPVLTLCVDVVPGWAIRFAAHLSTRIATAFPEACAVLPRAEVTGYPVREEFLQADRAAARRRFGVPEGVALLFVFGGSLGARAINRALVEALERLLPVAHVIHVVGQAGGEVAPPTLPPELLARYQTYSYLEAVGMADGLAAADLVVCRAGAATMAELPLAGTPAILIPGAFSAQADNAQALAARGAATVIADRDLSATRLADEVLALLADGERRAAMRAASRALAHREAAAAVAAMVRRLSDEAGARA